MKLWVVLVAATLLAGCGAEVTPPETTPPPPARIWGYLRVLGGAAQNATARLRGGPFLQRLQLLATEARSQADALGALMREDLAEARERVAEYGAEARTALEQSWGELRNRGAAYARKLRKRLSRDGDELRRRWDAFGQALGQKAAAIRRAWGAGGVGEGWGEGGTPQLTEV